MKKPIEIPNEVNCCLSILTVEMLKCVPRVLERLNRLQLYRVGFVNFNRYGPEHEIMVYLSKCPATKAHTSLCKSA